MDVKIEPEAPIYQLAGVSKVYRKGGREIPAVRDLDLEIRAGEWLAVQARPATARPRCYSSSAAWTGRPGAGWSSAARTWPRPQKHGCEGAGELVRLHLSDL